MATYYVKYYENCKNLWRPSAGRVLAECNSLDEAISKGNSAVRGKSVNSLIIISTDKQLISAVKITDKGNVIYKRLDNNLVNILYNIAYYMETVVYSNHSSIENLGRLTDFVISDGADSNTEPLIVTSWSNTKTKMNFNLSYLRSRGTYGSGLNLIKNIDTLIDKVSFEAGPVYKISVIDVQGNKSPVLLSSDYPTKGVFAVYDGSHPAEWEVVAEAEYPSSIAGGIK